MLTFEQQVGRIKRVPPARLLDPGFPYVHSSKTDVQKTWRRFGWVPPNPGAQERMKLKLNRI